MKLEEMGVLMSQAIMPHLASHGAKGGLQRLLGWCLSHTINNTTEKGDTQNTLFQVQRICTLALAESADSHQQEVHTTPGSNCHDQA